MRALPRSCQTVIQDRNVKEEEHESKSIATGSRLIVIGDAGGLRCRLVDRHPAAAVPAAATATPDAGTGAGRRQPYIPLISKGFQHQFWQAVKSGAEKAAKEYNVKITFEGPETEARSTSRSTCCRRRSTRSPQAIGFAALD